MTTLDGLQPEFRSRLAPLLEEAGPRLRLNYGWRSREEQQRLYDGWQQRRPGFFAANAPGTSMHEIGLAADVDDLGVNAQLLTDLCHKYGFCRPHGNERWHLELDPNRKPIEAPTSQVTPAKEEEELPRYADKFVWPNGDQVQVAPDGSTKCFGAKSFDSIPRLKPDQKLSFTRADAVLPVDPQNSQAGYVICNENGDRYRFDANTFK